MDYSMIIMWLGFILAGYAVVGNDSIQTLGTFLSSNEEKPWYVLWGFAGSILAFTLLYGWYTYSGDVSYGRLAKYEFVKGMTWPYLLPPLVLMLLTRTGIPVSTSFLILTFFNTKNLVDMTMKSVLGYALAFCVAIVVWQLVTKSLDKKFMAQPVSDTERPRSSIVVGVAIALSGLLSFYDVGAVLLDGGIRYAIPVVLGSGIALGLSRLPQRSFWTCLQWGSTGFLWGQWLIQDFANIYVYLPRSLSGFEIGISLTVLLTMLGIIFYSKGGNIQKIVKAKTNTTDIRSATIVDFIYGILLLFFKEASNVPMSTTWVFLGLLAGREIAIRYVMELFNEPSDLKRAPGWHIAGVSLNVVLTGLIIALVGTFIYIKSIGEKPGDYPLLIPVAAVSMAVAMIARSFVAYKETIPGRLNLVAAYKDIGRDLAKVTFGLIVSIALVYLMLYLVPGLS